MDTKRDRSQTRSGERGTSARRGRPGALHLTGRASSRTERPADRSTTRTKPTTTSQSEAGEGSQLDGPTDPRWVLAVRAADQLEGAILRPEKRERLILLAKTMGLSPFDANLIIAIVQDQARRGYQPDYCPTAGEPQLAMVPHPSAARRLTGKFHNRRIMVTAATVMIFLALEAIVIKWLFF